MSQLLTANIGYLTNPLNTFFLGYTPMLDPLPFDNYWLWMILPLVFIIAMVYKTLKLEDLTKLPRQAIWLTMQIIVFMTLAAGVVWVLTEWI